jgi:glycosyltransferase involved in cell wall biosynthesis
MGWHWAVEIARLGHEVHVLTRANNVAEIERGIAELGGLPLKVHGYDLPRWARWWKKGPRGMRFYYVLWQWRAWRRARALHRAFAFDLVHHITFAVYRHPSFMGRLGIPFVFGPLGGGEYAPPALLRGLPWRGRIVEHLRTLANRLATADPLLRSTLRHASLILFKTPETLEQIPSRFHTKCIRVQDVAAEEGSLAATPSGSAAPHFLFAGRLLYWKGIHLALRALAEVRSQLPEARLTIVGKGRDDAWLERLAQQLGLESALDWRGFIPREDLLRLYAGQTAFVFPSLHDSGGTVVMEAMAQGLPVICLDLGGPGAILPADCGVKIPARSRTENEIIADLAAAMTSLALDTSLRGRLAANALSAARASTWGTHVSETYAHIQSRVFAGSSK